MKCRVAAQIKRWIIPKISSDILQEEEGEDCVDCVPAELPVLAVRSVESLSGTESEATSQLPSTEVWQGKHQFRYQVVKQGN